MMDLSFLENILKILSCLAGGAVAMTIVLLFSLFFPINTLAFLAVGLIGMILANSFADRYFSSKK